MTVPVNVMLVFYGPTTDRLKERCESGAFKRTHCEGYIGVEGRMTVPDASIAAAEVSRHCERTLVFTNGKALGRLLGEWRNGELIR